MTEHTPIQPTRVGCVQYLNTKPLVEGLDALAGCELVPTVPSKLIGTLLAQQTDVALVSVIDGLRSPEPLAVLPVGMIGSDGPTLTVRLYSTVPLGSVRRVYADTDSHTSVFLCRLLLKECHEIEPEMVDFDARERIAVARSNDRDAEAEGEWPETMLLIGDKVVTDSPPAVRYPYQLDLGAAWREWTGLPFVYATWMCLASRADDPSVRLAAAMLDRQRRHNATRLDWIATTHAPTHRWPADLAREYLGRSLRYELDARARAGFQHFYGLAKTQLVGVRKDTAPSEPRVVELGAAFSES